MALLDIKGPSGDILKKIRCAVTDEYLIIYTYFVIHVNDYY